MKKTIRGIAALLIAVVLLTMCGMTAFAEEKVTLTFWANYNEADETSIDAAWIKEAIAKFEENHPNVTTT